MASHPTQPQRRRTGTNHDEPRESLVSHHVASVLEATNPTFFLNNNEASATDSTSQRMQSPPPPQPEPEELPRCWICQQDATEDTPETSVWRRPCPCSLTAHDECLMEWITSQEAPKPGEMATTPKIVCPVCQAPIKIERPQDYLVMLADLIQKAAKSLMVPAALSALVGTIYSGLFVYGWNTMHIFFGYDEATRMLLPSAQEMRTRAMIEDSGFWRTFFRSVNLTDPFLPMPPGLRLFLGLPMIGPALVLSRTRLADQIFAILPVSYFVFHPTRRLDLTAWPPSPALTLAVLPYIRTTYNEIYKHTFSNLEKQWDKAVLRKPREGETAEQIAAEQNQRQPGGFLDIEVELIEEGEAPADVAQANDAGAGGRPGEEHGLRALVERQERQPGDHQQPRLNEEEMQEMLRRLENHGAPDVEVIRENLNQLRQLRAAVNAAQAEVAQGAGGPGPRAGRNNNGWEIRQNVSTAQIASTVMGALFFPAISSVMGNLLRLALPASWVTKETSRWGVKVSNGLLKEKWGRSIIGGCLFVVLKDAVTLYCKWKKARDFGKRKILDYVGERRQATA